MTGTIIGCTVGALIGIGLIAGTSVQLKKHTIKISIAGMFYAIGFAIILVAIISLIKGISQ